MPPAIVRTTIIDEMRRIAAEQKLPMPGQLDDDTPLVKTGLDSLGFAILVARLEEALGVDPFGAADDVTFPITVGDLVRFYEGSVTEVSG